MSKVVDKDRRTVPVVGVVGIEVVANGFWNKATTDIYRATTHSNDLVSTHQEVFGRQSYCYNGSERRYWVWERDGYRVFVANGFGLDIEVEQGTGADEAEAMMREYLSHWEPYLDEHLEMRFDDWIHHELGPDE